MAINAS